MKKNILILCMCIAQIFSAYCMDSEDAFNKYVSHIALNVGVVPIERVKGTPRSFRWNTELVDNERILISIPTGTNEAGNVLVTNRLVNVDTQEVIFEKNEALSVEGYRGPVVDRETIFLNNNQEIYFNRTGQTTQLENVYVRCTNPDRNLLFATGRLDRNPEKADILYILDNSGEILQTIKNAKDIRFGNNLSTFEWTPRNNISNYITFAQEDENKVLITNLRHVVTVPEEASWWYFGVNNPAQDGNYLHLFTKNFDQIITYDVTSEEFFHSKVFEFIWETFSNYNYLLIFEKDAPFCVWDFQNNERIAITGLDQVNEEAKKLGITPKSAFDRHKETARYCEFFAGSHKLLFRMLNDSDPSNIVCVFGIILDMATKSASLFTQENDFWFTQSDQRGTQEMYVHYTPGVCGDGELHNITKVDTNSVEPINWLENLTLQSLCADYTYFATHEDGFQEVIEVPSFLRYSHLMAKYFGPRTKLQYNSQADVVFIIEEMIGDELYSDNEIILSGDTQSKYRITIRNASTDELLADIYCDTYDFAVTESRIPKYLLTYKNEEFAKLLVWYIANKDVKKENEKKKSLISSLFSVFGWNE